ncbi:MAG: CdaR family protein [Firmicutes bacterium]|nr:CdaR family protein [Bacillota bacterium]MDY5997754.1 CdaR family protein [Erysipelotrichaceae bacterium]
MTNFNNDNQKNKTELANRIAKQSKKVASTYEHLENGFFKIIRIFSSWIDHVIFNPKYTKIVALCLAILLYITVNINNDDSIFASPLQSSKDISNLSVSAIYNSDVFELSGLPESVNVTVTGDSANVTSAVNMGGYIIANLEGLTEGTHQVKLTSEGFNSNVNIKIDPSNAVVTLKKKTTRQFDISYDFINLDKMENIYSLGTPVFEYAKVNVRASKETLDSITFVKALIDVTNVTGEFTQKAKIVAYDKNGQPVNADIVPDEISVTVPVSSPNKVVPIEVEINGTLPDNLAIDSISMDQKSVTIYASESVLSKIDKVVVTLDASTISKDTTILRPISLPSGVNSSNVNQLTLDIKVKEAVTKVIDNVNIYYRNNTNNYKFTPVDGKTTTSVEVSGTLENVESITADDIYVSFDMGNARPGVQEFTLSVDQPSSSLVKYTLKDATYSVNVLGETTETTEDDNINNDNG